MLIKAIKSRLTNFKDKSKLLFILHRLIIN
jgi:hypothetical protein